MLTRPSRRAAAFGILTLLVLASSAVVTASSGRRADAICTGQNSPLAIEHKDANGNIVAREAVPWPFTTCDGDSHYTGILEDSLTDGSCAYGYYLEPLSFYGLEAVSCTTGAWVGYSYNDTILGNSAFVSARPSYLPDEWKLSSGY